MQKEEILEQINQTFDALYQWLDQHDPSEFSSHPRSEKWSAGQHIDHLLRATKPINKALKMPKMMLKVSFGTNNREERSYQATQDRYLGRLSEGVVATGDFIPGEIQNEEKDALVEKLKKEQQLLVNKLSKWSEADLSKYILPHPAIGKLSIRELLYFVDFHTKRHHETLLEFH